MRRPIFALEKMMAVEVVEEVAVHDHRLHVPPVVLHSTVHKVVLGVKVNREAKVCKFDRMQKLSLSYFNVQVNVLISSWLTGKSYKVCRQDV